MADAAPEQTAPVTPPQSATSDDITRFLTLALHEEEVLNNRINIFLLVESILLVFAVEAGARIDHIRDITFVAGLIITVIWFLMIVRQWLDLKSASEFLHEHWPALKRRKNYVPRFMKTLTLHAMLWVLPLTFVGLWLAVRSLPANFTLS